MCSGARQGGVGSIRCAGVACRTNGLRLKKMCVKSAHTMCVKSAHTILKKVPKREKRPKSALLPGENQGPWDAPALHPTPARECRRPSLSGQTSGRASVEQTRAPPQERSVVTGGVGSRHGLDPLKASARPADTKARGL